MNKKFLDFITNLNKYASEKNIPELIKILEYRLKEYKETNVAMKLELAKLPFSYPEIFENNELLEAWSAVIKNMQSYELTLFVYLCFHERIVKGTSTAKLLKYFYKAMDNSFFDTNCFMSRTFTFATLLDDAMAMDDNEFIMEAFRIISDIFKQVSVEWKISQKFARYFISKKMYKEFEETFATFYNNSFESYMYYMEFEDVDEIETTLEIIDYISDEKEREKRRDSYFSTCVNFIALDVRQVEAERLRRLAFLKEAGFKTKKANTIFNLIGTVEKSVIIDLCKDMIDDNARLYINMLKGSTSKEVLDKIDLLLTVRPDIELTIDECPHETNLFTDVSCCSAMIMSFIKPLLKKYKITSTEDLRNNQYVRMLCKIESDGRYPLIEYLCSEYENAPLELAELFTELKDFKALSCVMQHKK